MYISLNKKIFYALFLVLVFIAILFLSVFLKIYGIENEKNQNTFRNNYAVELLHENIQLRRELGKFIQSPENELTEREKELTYQKKINQELQENYNQRWETFIVGGKIIAVSSVISLLLIIILGFLLQRWVTKPIDKLDEISRLIANGDYSKRIELKRKKSFDEIDTLAQTFNQMIDNIEKNITEIKNTEIFLQSLIDAIPDGIRVINRDYDIIMTNKAYMKQTRQCSFKKCYNIYGCEYPCPEGTVTCPLREIKLNNTKSINIIHNICGHPFAISAAPLKINKVNQPEDFYIVEIMRDLSEDIRFSHEQKISSLGFLATSVAHEMKNNLGAIRMILEGLLNKDNSEKISNEDKEKYLQMIYKQIISGIELPESLLRLARNNGESKEIIDVNHSIEEVLALLDYEAKRNGITVCQHNMAQNTEITGNAADFKMIILNISQNAFKAMPDGGRFDVSINKNKNMVLIEFKDTGIGIAPEKIPHIFEPFYSEGHHSRHKGTGLGLAIVKSLVDKFKGTINVSSITGKGTTFEIKIPKNKRNNLQS